MTKILPPKKKFTQPGVAEFPRLSLIRDAGQISGAGRMGGKLQLITLAPDRTVYRYLINADAFHGSRAGWENIRGQASGPLTVLSSDNGRIDLFAPGPKAAALHAHWNINDEISPVPEWNDLGGKVRGDIIAVRSESERIDLFAAGEDHAVYHKTVMDDGRSDARGDWRSLGGMFRDPMMAIRSTQGGFEVFATGMDGGVFHKRYSNAKDGEPSVEEWKCLGGQFNGVLVAELSDNENIMLLAFSDDRMAYYKTWNGKNWEPSKTEWISIGSIDSLEDALSENNGPEVEGAPNTECI